MQKKILTLSQAEGILQDHIQNECVPVDDALHEDLLAIMDKHVF